VSTSLLYHSFGIRDHAYVSTEYREGTTVFHVTPKEDALRCPACRSREVIRKGIIPRRLRSLPIGHRPTWIEVPVQRVGCKDCGVIRQIDLQFADPRRSYTRPFGKFVVDLCRVLPMQDVARFLRVSWDVVKDIAKLPDTEQRQALKGSRWLLLKDPGNLDSSRDEQERLRKALELNEPLAKAYYLKEDLRRFWDQPSQAAGIAFLLDWIERAQASGVRMLERFAQTLINHWQGLIAYFEHPITTGPLEGLNNKIKTLKRQAYGFRDTEFFKLRIKGVHEARYAFTG